MRGDDDVTNDHIRSLDITLTKLADQIDDAVIQAKAWMASAKKISGEFMSDKEAKAQTISAHADMAAVSLRLAELFQTNYTMARHERQQEVVFERARQARQAQYQDDHDGDGDV